MFKADINDLGKSLYGPEATQMLGGGKKGSDKQASKKKTDSTKKPTKKKEGSKAEYEIVPYPEYCEHEDFKKFMHNFYLYKVMTMTKAAAIYVIPPTKELNEMIQRFEAEIRKQGFEPMSEQALRWSASNSCEYRRCIFDVFGDADPMSYRIAKETAAYNEFGIVKRTNRLCEQYWFKYIDPTTILISPSEECKSGEKVKLIAKCPGNSSFIFQGKIPKAEKMYSKALLTGGNADEMTENDLKTILTKKRRFLEEHGAEKFVYSMSVYNDIVKHFSGDIIHTAFCVLYDKSIVNVPSAPIKRQQLECEARKLIKKMKLISAKTDLKQCQQHLKNYYYRSASNNAFDATQKYIKTLKTYYQKAGGTVMLKADISTNMWKNGFGGDLSAIMDVAEGIERPESSDLAHATRFDFNHNDKEFTTSKLNSIIDTYLGAYPFIGITAKKFVPFVAFKGGDVDEDELEEIEEKKVDVDNLDEFI